MRKVFDNREVFHVYAQQSQEEGRTSSGNVFFEGTRIWSYGRHYLLGNFINTSTIIINDIGYSSTTGKHISYLTSATSQYKQFFRTEIDVEIVNRDILELEKKLTTARKPENYVLAIIRRFELLTDFLKQHNKEMLKSDEYKEIKKIYNKLSKDKDKYLELLKERGKKEFEQKKIRIAKSVEEFMQHEKGRVHHDAKEQFIRISKDNEFVETSLGVKVEAPEALKLFLAIEKGLPIEGYRISYYRVNKLGDQLVIGCHKINKKNVFEVGAKLKELLIK